MKLPTWLRYHGDALLMPLFLAGVYTAFVITADATGGARILAGVFLLVVVALWMAFRRLRVHAAAARLAAIGEPAQLLTLADEELKRRWFPAGNVPLHIYRAMAHNLAGRPAEAQAALIASKLKPGERATRSWQLLWGATDIDTRTRLGDAVGARKTFDQIVVPFARLMPGRGIDLIVAECQARVLLAEGDAAGARELIAPLVKDMRLGPAARGQLYAIRSGCDAKLGDEVGAAAAATKARELAPSCVLLL
jgi:hypothetical protein